MPEAAPAAAPAPDPKPEVRESAADSVWAFIQGIMKEALEPHGLSIFSPFAEKHGSWEATFYRAATKDHDGICRFVLLDFTNESAPSITGPNVYNVEAWETAEKDDKFFRRLVDQFTAKDDEFRDERFRNALISLLNKAARNVLDLPEQHLTASYNERRIGTKLPKR